MTQPARCRCVEVPLAIRLDQLHLVVQAAVGRENHHLYEFGVGSEVRYGVPDPDWSDMGSSCLPVE